jgi:hypothetical protein
MSIVFSKIMALCQMLGWEEVCFAETLKRVLRGGKGNRHFGHRSHGTYVLTHLKAHRQFTGLSEELRLSSRQASSKELSVMALPYPSRLSPRANQRLKSAVLKHILHHKKEHLFRCSFLWWAISNLTRTFLIANNHMKPQIKFALFLWRL